MDKCELDLLMKRCMRIVPGREDTGLDVVYSANKKFKEYISRFDIDSIARVVTGFIHRGGIGDLGDTYIDSKSDSLCFSAYDVFGRVDKGSLLTGNCVGTSQVCAYFLLSEGMGVRPLLSGAHVYLATKVGGEWLPIETTVRHGFDYRSGGKVDVLDMNDLESLVWDSQGSVFENVGDFDAAINCYSNTLKITPGLGEVYSNRGGLMMRKKRFDLAIEDYTCAMKLGSGNKEIYFNRGMAFGMIGEMNLAIEDFEKYASFGEESMKKVVAFFDTLRSGNVEK